MTEDIRVNKGILDPKDLWVYLDSMAAMEPKAQRATLEHMVHQVQKDLWVHLVVMVPLVLREIVDLLDIQAKRVQMVLLVAMD